MPKLSKRVIITEFDAYNERIEIVGNKYIVDKEPEVVKEHWSQHLVHLLAFNHLKDKKERTEVFRHQDRSYDRKSLSLKHENHFNKNFGSDSVKTSNETSFIEKDIESRKLSKNRSFDSISDDYKSDSISQRSQSSSQSITSLDSSSISSSDCDSLNDTNERKKFETIRVIQRFGNGFEDHCLFPLALSLNLTDLTKGKITWDSINTKADLLLNKWCSLYSRKVNRVLPTASDFVCPEPSLQNKFLLNPKKTNKPLKRWNSYEDIYAVNRQKVSTNKTFVSTDDSFFTRNQFKSIEKTDNNCLKRKSIQRSDSKELVVLEPFSSPLFIKRSSFVQNSTRIEAKSLLKNIRANSPLSLAVYITEINKQYYLQLKECQLFHTMVGDCGLNQKKDLRELKDMLEFGSELNKFVVQVIRRQITPETQGIKIAGFIEVSCILRKLRNWQSLVTVIQALQSPKIYFMEEAWMTMKKTYPVHFNDYLKLCQLVRLNQTCIIGSTIGPSIPSLASMLSRISLHCIATWDLLEHKRRWTEHPSIAGWVDSELIGQLVESQKLRQKQEERYMLSEKNSYHSLLPINDPIRLIPYSSLPTNWTQKDIKYITYSYLKPIVKCFRLSFNKEMDLIRQYNIPSAHT